MCSPPPTGITAVSVSIFLSHPFTELNFEGRVGARFKGESPSEEGVFPFTAEKTEAQRMERFVQSAQLLKSGGKG